MNGKGTEKGIMASRHRAEYTAKYSRQGFPSNAPFELYVFSSSNRHESIHIERLQVTDNLDISIYKYNTTQKYLTAKYSCGNDDDESKAFTQ
jgi:hypothetical protein